MRAGRWAADGADARRTAGMLGVVALDTTDCMDGVRGGGAVDGRRLVVDGTRGGRRSVAAGGLTGDSAPRLPAGWVEGVAA